MDWKVGHFVDTSLQSQFSSSLWSALHTTSMVFTREVAFQP
jgi:hypothetical protein